MASMILWFYLLLGVVKLLTIQTNPFFLPSYGYNNWRDPEKPSQILTKLCRAFKLDGPYYSKGKVLVGKTEFTTSECFIEDESGKAPTPLSLRVVFLWRGAVTTNKQMSLSFTPYKLFLRNNHHGQIIIKWLWTMMEASHKYYFNLEKNENIISKRYLLQE